MGTSKILWFLSFLVFETQFWLGLLIFAFYFTSNILLYYQHLLVNMEQHSKKDLDSEQVSIS